MNPRALVLWAVVIALAAYAVWQMSQPPRPPVVVQTIKPVNVTPAMQTPAPSPSPLPLCDATLLRIDNKFTACGVIQYDGRAVMIQRGWVQGQFSGSGLEVCVLKVQVNTVYLNCTAPVLIWPSS